MTDKITLTDLVNLENQTTAVNAINTNNEIIELAFDNTLSRDGTAPNQMGANLDMNSNRILNLPYPASANEPLRYVDGVTAGLVGPAGPAGPAGAPGTGTVTSITGGTGISVTGTSTVPIVTNTGVTSVTAGIGISISGSSTPTITNSGVTSLTAGTGISLTGTSSVPIVNATSVSPTNNFNFLPNTQWQLWTATGFITKQNSTGTGSQAPVTCTSFDTANNQPRFFTSNTQALRVGDIVSVSGGSGSFTWIYPGIGVNSTANGNRVVAINPNVSVTVQGNLGAISPASSFSGVVIVPIICGMSTATGSGQCADGWKKSTTTGVWADDWANNSCVGAIRTLGVIKGTSGQEAVNWTAPTAQMARYAGKAISFGVLVKQGVQGGAGTWRAFINDNISAVTYSSSGTGVSFGGFQYLSVTATVASTSTSLSIGVSFDGNASDVYYVATPTAVFGSNISQGNLGQPLDEIARPVGHWNPPLLTPLAVQFASALAGTSPTAYGWTGIDMEAISLCTCHKSVVAVKCKIEWLTATLDAYIFTSNAVDYSLVFGPQAITNVINHNFVGQGWLPLHDDGTFAIWTGTNGLTPTAGTFDFDLVQLSSRWSAN